MFADARCVCHTAVDVTATIDTRSALMSAMLPALLRASTMIFMPILSMMSPATLAAAHAYGLPAISDIHALQSDGGMAFRGYRTEVMLIAIAVYVEE